MSVFPREPIGFKVLVMGWEDGVPYLDLEIGIGGRSQFGKFRREYGFWKFDGENLDLEEQGFLRQIWSTECDNRGIPNDRR